MKAVAIPFFSIVVACLALVGFLVDAGFLIRIISKTVHSVEASLTNAGYELNYKIANGILTITYKNQSENVGTVALPLNTLCQVPEVNTYFTCYICNDDCIYVHNTYGGKCGPNPTSPGNTTCLCADTQEDATARNISANTRETCDAYYVDPNFSKYILDPLLVQVLRARMDVVQCLQVADSSATPGYNSTGCIADCVQNHGYASGVCGKETPNVGSPGYFNETQPHFCLCSNTTSTA